MVKEFYANAIVNGEEIKYWVRGKSFSVTPIYLAEILHINWPILPIPPIYDELNPDEEVLKKALGANLEFSSNRKSISVASLSLPNYVFSQQSCVATYILCQAPSI